MVDPFEANTYAFIIRIWYERREITGADPEWRGVIESLSSGDRRYLKNLTDIPEIIEQELQAAGHALPQHSETKG